MKALTNLIPSLPLEWNLPARNTRQFLDYVTASITHTTNDMLVNQELISFILHLLQGVTHFLQPWRIGCCYKTISVFSSFFLAFITTVNFSIICCGKVHCKL